MDMIYDSGALTSRMLCRTITESSILPLSSPENALSLLEQAYSTRMKLTLAPLALLAVIGTLASPSHFIEDDEFSLNEPGTSDSEILSYLLDIQTQEDNAVDFLPRGCRWFGTSPFCAPSCPRGYRERHTNRCGDGVCCLTGRKKLCCL
ncbi:hypothetical protein D9613_008159 [Agrocybe pediades]|uniref:Uncharacterized protein n=1 Tax=Agrocybe pediades TaxID=84607 RepID=A0A8H4QNE2_9AGAR|nr:hypothetical protein D9613_008159 [Agrocybe pediades]KAF9544956.1 hypothetical protein CPC08DRAFT_397570 [Agrocybe pediades]